MMKRWFALLALMVALAGMLPAQNTSTFGNITVGAANCGGANCVYYQLPPGTPYVVVTATGTWSGTLNFQSISAPNANYSNLNTVAWTLVAAESVNGTWSVATGGATFLLVEAPSGFTGAATVTMAGSQTGSPLNNPVFPGDVTAAGFTVVGAPAGSYAKADGSGYAAVPVNGVLLGTDGFGDFTNVDPYIQDSPVVPAVAEGTVPVPTGTMSKTGWTAYHVHGASISAGWGASSCAFDQTSSTGTCYPDLIAQYTGTTAAMEGYAAASNQWCDVSNEVFADENPGASSTILQTLEANGNDPFNGYLGGGSYSGVGIYEHVAMKCAGAALAWLAIPSTYKTVAPTAATHWSKDTSTYGNSTNPVMLSTTNGAAQTFSYTLASTTATAQEVDLFYKCVDAVGGVQNHGSFSVEDSYDSLTWYVNTYTVPTMSTNNNPTNTQGLCHILLTDPGRNTAGTYTLTVTVTSPTASTNVVPVIGPGVFPPAASQNPVYAMPNIRAQNDQSQSYMQVYINDLLNVASLLQSNGLSAVNVVNCRNYIFSTPSEMNASTSLGLYHPSDAGHAEIAKCFEGPSAIAKWTAPTPIEANWRHTATTPDYIGCDDGTVNYDGGTSAGTVYLPFCGQPPYVGSSQVYDPGLHEVTVVTSGTTGSLTFAAGPGVTLGGVLASYSTPANTAAVYKLKTVFNYNGAEYWELSQGGGASLSTPNDYTANGAASTPGAIYTGTPYTGGTAATNYPYWFMNFGTTPTNFNTLGELWGINCPSGYSGYAMHLFANGANKMEISCGGQINAGAFVSGSSGAGGSLTMGNATSGTITLEPATGALGTITEYLPISSGDTLAGIAATQTLTNKTLTSPTLTTPALGTPASGVITNLTGTCTSCTANAAAGLTGTPAIAVSAVTATTVTGSGLVTGGNDTSISSNYTNATTSYTSIMAMPTVAANATINGVCSLIWSDSSTAGTATLAAKLSAAPASYLHVQAVYDNGAYVAPTVTGVSTTTQTAITGAMATTAANAYYVATIYFSLYNGASANTLTLYGESNNSSYTVTVWGGSFCTWLP